MKVNYFKNQNRRSFRKGMTLLEIVIVLGIIALIMAAGVASFGGIMGSANDQAAKMKAQSIRTALEAYKLAGGMYPTQSQGLKALVAKPSSAPVPKRWKQQMSSVPLDPWQNEYAYKFPGSKDRSTPEIISKGEDGQLGTDDDVSSQEDM